jgi:hypothetical protein
MAVQSDYRAQYSLLRQLNAQALESLTDAQVAAAAFAASTSQIPAETTRVEVAVSSFVTAGTPTNALLRVFSVSGTAAAPKVVWIGNLVPNVTTNTNVHSLTAAVPPKSRIWVVAILAGGTSPTVTSAVYQRSIE